MVVWILIAGLVAVVAAALPVGAALYLVRRSVRPGKPVCQRCGYPRQGARSHTCPECGFAWGDGTVLPRLPLWAQVLIGVMLLLAPFAALVVFGLVLMTAAG